MSGEYDAFPSSDDWELPPYEPLPTLAVWIVKLNAEVAASSLCAWPHDANFTNDLDLHFDRLEKLGPGETHHVRLRDDGDGELLFHGTSVGSVFSILRFGWRPRRTITQEGTLFQRFGVVPPLCWFSRNHGCAAGYPMFAVGGQLLSMDACQAVRVVLYVRVRNEERLANVHRGKNDQHGFSPASVIQITGIDFIAAGGRSSVGGASASHGSRPITLEAFLAAAEARDVSPTPSRLPRRPPPPRLNPATIAEDVAALQEAREVAPSKLGAQLLRRSRGPAGGPSPDSAGDSAAQAKLSAAERVAPRTPSVGHVPMGATVQPDIWLNDMTASMTPPPPPDAVPAPVDRSLRPSVDLPQLPQPSVHGALFEGSREATRPWRGVPPPPPYDSQHPGPKEPMDSASRPSAPLIDLTAEPSVQEVDRQLAWAEVATRARASAAELQMQWNLGRSEPRGPPPPRPPLPPAPPGFSHDLGAEGRFIPIKEYPRSTPTKGAKPVFIPKAYRSMTTSKGGARARSRSRSR
ncbi:hypothetical protein N9L68_03165 [bacterium]|nr:hypothetical protein [bacterium]